MTFEIKVDINYYNGEILRKATLKVVDDDRRENGFTSSRYAGIKQFLPRLLDPFPVNLVVKEPPSRPRLSFLQIIGILRAIIDKRKLIKYLFILLNLYYRIYLFYYYLGFINYALNIINYITFLINILVNMV